MYIGLDVGGTNLKAARVAPDGALIERRHDPIQKGSAAELFDQLERVIHDLGGETAAAVGIGVPGIIDHDGRVIAAPNVPVLDGWFVAEEMFRRTGRPTFIENDANAAALAEAWLGAGGGVENLLFITLGTGVGGGLVLGGRVWAGISGYAGEIGHIQVEENGAPCGFGADGCVETFAGAAGWNRLAQERLIEGRSSVLVGKALDPKVIADAARNGDALALEVVDEVARAVGIGIAAALLIMNVDRVVIGGGIARAGNVLLEPVVKHVRKRIFDELFAESMIRLAEMGGDAGMLGAARVAILGLAAQAHT